MVRVCYFVHDLSDAAVRRRVRMFLAGGATVRLFGFHRTEAPPPEIEGVVPSGLGQTRAAALVHRVTAVASALLRMGRLAEALRDCDVVVARNLEMLVLAIAARSRYAPRTPVVYECLDIHRSMLSDRSSGRVLRWIERLLLKRCSSVLVSSPAFLREYFVPRQSLDRPALLVENKVLDLDGSLSAAKVADVREVPGPPWRIGWFGVIRCRRSLDLLCALAERMDGRVEIVIRGRPALHEFADFHGKIAATPHVRFEGPYRNPEDLAAIYGDVHYAWAIDYFEAGLNSDWLLPNRIYEGGVHGVVPIASAGVETGRFLAGHGVGLLLPEPLFDDLVRFFETLDPETRRAQAAAVVATPARVWIADVEDCRLLVRRLVAPSQPSNCEGL